MEAFISVFLGALLAFVFAFFLYIYQKKSQDGYYLAFLITYITSQISVLYCLKKDIIVSRKNEIKNLEKSLSQQTAETEVVKLEMKEISKFITNPNHSNPDVSIERISFLADSDPNLIILVKAALNADSDVTDVIHSCNEQIKVTKADLSIPNIWLLAQVNINLEEQVDYAIALLEHSQSQLVEFSKNEFKDFVSITGFSMDKDYESLKPSINNSLLSIKYEYKHRPFQKRMLRVFNRLKSCI